MVLEGMLLQGPSNDAEHLTLLHFRSQETAMEFLEHEQLMALKKDVLDGLESMELLPKSAWRVPLAETSWFVHCAFCDGFSMKDMDVLYGSQLQIYTCTPCVDFRFALKYAAKKRCERLLLVPPRLTGTPCWCDVPKPGAASARPRPPP